MTPTTDQLPAVPTLSGSFPAKPAPCPLPSGSIGGNQASNAIGGAPHHYFLSYHAVLTDGGVCTGAVADLATETPLRPADLPVIARQVRDMLARDGKPVTADPVTIIAIMNYRNL